MIYRLWRCSCSEHCGRKHIRIQRDRVLRTLICQVWQSRMVSQQNRSAPVGTNRLRRPVPCLRVQSTGLQRQDSGDLGHKVQGTGLTWRELLGHVELHQGNLSLDWAGMLRWWEHALPARWKDCSHLQSTWRREAAVTDSDVWLPARVPQLCICVNNTTNPHSQGLSPSMGREEKRSLEGGHL